MTTSFSVKICISIKTVAIAHALLVGFMDPDYGHCHACLRCMNTKSAHIATESVSKIVAVCLTTAISGYVALKIIRVDNKIQPVVAAPLVEVSAVCKTDDTSLDLEDIEDDSIKSENDVKMSVFEALESNLVGESSTKKGKEQKPLACNQPKISAMDSQSKNVKSKMSVVMKTALTMNLLTLFITLNVLPQQFLNIIYKNCNNSNGGCVDYLRLTDPTTGVRLLVLFLHPILVLRKIKKIHQITGI